MSNTPVATLSPPIASRLRYGERLAIVAAVFIIAIVLAAWAGFLAWGALWLLGVV